jgi:hypothetical protein
MAICSFVVLVVNNKPFIFIILKGVTLNSMRFVGKDTSDYIFI